MKVTQPDSRSISIVSNNGVKIFFPYRIFWNGHERSAESILLMEIPGPQGAFEVRAFFLFGEIRDRITEDAAGVTLSRAWSVQTPGSVLLSIDAELDPPADLAWLFPGVQAARGLPAAAISFLGRKTTYPCSLFLALGRKGVLLFTPSATCKGTPGSIGIGRTEVEDEPPRLHVQVRFPGIEKPAERIGPKPEDFQATEGAFIESSGRLERSQELCLAFSSREEIGVRGPFAALQRIASPQEAARPVPDLAEPGVLADAVQDVLGRHLYQKGGVIGLRETSDSPWISASAGVGCALALHKLFPEDARFGELGLRLADFALKSQVSWGIFHESYHVPSSRWCGVRGRPDTTLVSVGQSARVAELLLAFAEELRRKARPHEKYFLAGLRFVDFFLDEKGKLIQPGELHAPGSSVLLEEDNPGLAGLEVFFPTAGVYVRTGRDRYKKALDALVRRFSGLPWDVFQPPASREGRGPDSSGALLAARLYVQMRALRYKPAEPPVTGTAAARAKAAESARLFAALLVPWIRVQNESRGGRRAMLQSGFLLDSFARQRLISAGHQTALLLLQLEALTPDAAGKQLLSSLARDCLASARCVPIGTAFVGETAGPVDCRRLMTEVLAGLQLAEEFPHFS